jgi:hypothetical protein
MCFVYSAVFTLLAAFYASIDFVKHSCIYFTQAWPLFEILRIVHRDIFL